MFCEQIEKNLNKIQSSVGIQITNYFFQRMQEIKFLYCKEQNINRQLYNIQLECMQYCNGLWQLIENPVEKTVHSLEETIFTYQNAR
jgi:hypothetical protein